MKATLSDCPIAHVLSMVDGSAVPSFISYDAKTNNLQIAPTNETHCGNYAIKIAAHSSNGVTPYLTDF